MLPYVLDWSFLHLLSQQSIEDHYQIVGVDVTVEILNENFWVFLIPKFLLGIGAKYIVNIGHISLWSVFDPNMPTRLDWKSSLNKCISLLLLFWTHCTSQVSLQV